MGIEDYSDYVQDRWYQSTTDEINGHVPQGASLHPVLDKGSNILKELVTPSTPPTATATGSYSTETGNGYTRYTFAGGGRGSAKIKSIDYNAYADQGNLQGCDAAFAYTQITLPGVVSKPANPTRITSITFTARTDISRGTKVGINLANAGYYNVYDCTTWEDCYRASGVSRSYIAKGAYVSGGGSGGGSITIHDYVPEETRDRKWAYYTRVPGSAVAQTKTFLMS